MKKQKSESKRRAGRTMTVVGLAAIMLIVGIVSVACSGSDESSTTSTTLASSGTTGSTLPNRLVVGGKSAEEYAAEIPELMKALEAAPEDLTLLQALAVAQYNTDDLEGAAATYVTMLGIEDSPVIHNNYGNVLRDQNKTEEAKAQYLAAIEADPAHVNAYVNVIPIIARDGDTAGALALLDQGIANTSGEDKTRLEDLKARLTGNE